MGKRIDRDVSGSGPLARRPVGNLAAKGKKAGGKSDRRAIRKSLDGAEETSLAVKVRRKWNATRHRFLGRFDVYRRYAEIPMGLYIDYYA